jgi:hypothetical protein
MKSFRWISASLATAMCVGFVPYVSAQSLTATWYTVSSSDPDRPFPYDNGTLFNNEVLPTLGPDNLPEFNSSYGGPAIQDLYLHDGVQEITWWSPAHDSNVTATGSTTVTLPINWPCTSSSNCVFPPNGAGTHDAGTAGYQAAVFAADITPKTTETVSFSVGADDVAFAYLNGMIVCDLGGVHPDSPGTCTTGVLNGGSNNVLEIFYADLRPAAAAFSFGMVTNNVSVCPPGTSGPNCSPISTKGVPAPDTLSLIGLSLLAFAGYRLGRTAHRQGTALPV